MTEITKPDDAGSDTPPPSLGLGKFGSALLDKIPQWFVVLLGLIYGTGFLTVFCFANYFGIRGAVVEGLKAKYVHVGILCLQFPFSIGIILLATLSMMRKPTEPATKTDEAAAAKATAESDAEKEKKEKAQKEIERQKKRRMQEAWAMSTFSALMLFFFYLLSTFARPGHFAEHEIGIAGFFFVIVVGALFMAWQRGLFWKGARFRRELLDLWSVEIRWLLVLILFVQTVVVFRSLPGLLWEMFHLGGYMYFLLVFLIGEFMWRLKGRYDSDNGGGLFPAYASMGLTICAALFYLSTMTFAYRVYPYIPVSKGGGDYTEEPFCILKFDEKYEKSIPKDIIDLTQTNCLQSKPVMLIDETDNRLFVAQTNAISNPIEWRKPGHLNKPKIITIRREVVTGVEY